MIDLIVTGCEQPEQSRKEIARLLKEYGVGAVCLLRCGRIIEVSVFDEDSRVTLKEATFRHRVDGTYPHPHGAHYDIIRVYPPGTPLRVTVEVVE